jgi:DNA-binding NarL/FixJ family response regulator
VRTILGGHHGFDVCAEVADGAEAIEQAMRLKPDVVVWNISMPVLSGLEAAREITAKLPESAIVILSSHADEQFIQEAKRAGAHAYVAKTKIGAVLIKGNSGRSGLGGICISDLVRTACSEYGWAKANSG